MPSAGKRPADDEAAALALLVRGDELLDLANAARFPWSRLRCAAALQVPVRLSLGQPSRW